MVSKPCYMVYMQMPRQDHQERAQEQSTHVLRMRSLHGGHAVFRSKKKTSPLQVYMAEMPLQDQMTSQLRDHTTDGPTTQSTPMQPTSTRSSSPVEHQENTVSRTQPTTQKGKCFSQPNLCFSGDSEYSARVFGWRHTPQEFLVGGTRVPLFRPMRFRPPPFRPQSCRKRIRAQKAKRLS